MLNFAVLCEMSSFHGCLWIPMKKQGIWNLARDFLKTSFLLHNHWNQRRQQLSSVKEDEESE